MAKRFFIILVLAILSVSCESDYESALVTQEENIDKYLSNFTDYEIIHNGGSNRVILTQGSGSTVEKGDVISFTYEGYVFDTNGPTSLFSTDYITNATVGKGSLIKGLDLGLEGTKYGEEALIVFSARYGYGKDAMNVVPEQSALLFLVKINSVSKHQD